MNTSGQAEPSPSLGTNEETYKALSQMRSSLRLLLLTNLFSIGSYGALEKALDRRSFRRCLARKRWDLSVPIGMVRMSAISAYVISWRWRMINTLRYLAGRFSICSRTMACRASSSRISSACLFTPSRIYSASMAACRDRSRLRRSSCFKAQ